MVDLTDWADGNGPQSYDAPPAVRLTAYTTELRAPGEGNKLAGYTGIDPNRGRTYITIRRRNEHYYRKGGGYAISLKILAKLQHHNVETVVVHVADRDCSWVFQLKQYLKGDEVPTAYTPGGEPQRVIAVADAVERFEQARVPITDLRR